MRKITITLEEGLARWALAEAARKDTSVSRLVSDVIKERMIDGQQYECALREALARKPFFKSKGPYLSRDAVHDRARLR